MYSTAHPLRRLAVGALAIGALAGTLAACGDDGPETPATTTPATEPTEPTEPTDTDSAPDTTGAGSEPAGSEPAGSEPGTSEADGDLPTEETAADLVGLDEDEAEETATERGWAFRVVRRDGEDLPATMDLRENRVNVEVDDGVVTAIANIG